MKKHHTPLKSCISPIHTVQVYDVDIESWLPVTEGNQWYNSSISDPSLTWFESGIENALTSLTQGVDKTLRKRTEFYALSPGGYFLFFSSVWSRYGIGPWTDRHRSSGLGMFFNKTVLAKVKFTESLSKWRFRL